MRRLYVLSVLCVLLALVSSTAWSLGLGTALRRSSAPAPRLSIANRIALGTLTATNDSTAAPVQLASAVTLGNLTPTSTSNVYLTGIQAAVLTGTVGRAVNGVTIHSDDFTGTTGTLLADHDPNWASYGPWDEVYNYAISRVMIVNDMVYAASTTSGAGAFYQPSNSDTVSMLVKGSSTSASLKGLTLRSNAGTSSATGMGYQIYLSNALSGYWKRVSVARLGTVLGYVSTNTLVSADHTLRAVFTGGSIAITVDGAAKGSVTDPSPLAPGHPGFFIAGSLSSDFLDTFTTN